MDMTSSPVAKLPVLNIVRRAYLSVSMHPGTALRCAWPWLAVMTPVIFAVAWGVFPWTEAVSAKVEKGGDTGVNLSLVELMVSFLGSNFDTLIQIPALASIAVTWHRLLLTSEPPGAASLRFDRPVKGYIAFSLVVALIEAIPFAETGAPQHWMVMTAAFIFSLVVAVFILPRLSLYLPAVALERNDVSLRQVWRVTHGNTWRLAYGSFLSFLPLMAGMLGIILLLPITDKPASRLVMATYSVAIFWLTVVTMFIAVAFLSYAYRHFFERPGQPATAQAG